MVPWALQKSPSYLQRAKGSFLGAPSPPSSLLLRLSGLGRLTLVQKMGLRPFLPSNRPRTVKMPGNQERGSVPFGETEDLCITSNQCVGGSNTYHKQNRSQESEGGEQTDQKIIKRHVCVRSQRDWEESKVTSG